MAFLREPLTSMGSRQKFDSKMHQFKTRIGKDFDTLLLKNIFENSMHLNYTKSLL